VSEYRVFKVTHMTCGHCHEDQRVRIRLIGAVEILPSCSSCGEATWLNSPTPRDQTARAVAQPVPQWRRVLGPRTEP
jgi:hypothetical protein